jgi:protein-arginine kinase activator protein McsA
MKCEKCGIKPATSHVVSIVNGKKEEHHYCSDCFENGFPIGNLIRGIGKCIDNYEDNDDDDFYEDAEFDENGIPYEYSAAGYDNIIPFDLIDGIARLAAKEVYDEEKSLEDDKLNDDNINWLSQKEKSQENKPLIVCPACGTTSENISKTRKAGCYKCYSVFETMLMERYRKYYDGKTYHGKIYSSHNMNNDIDYLQRELSVAVKNQNYERAAEIRDNIKKLQLINSKSIKNKRCKRGKIE